MTAGPHDHAPLLWLHIGDLHVAAPDAENVRDFRAIVSAAAALPPGAVDFVLLPGDNADNGRPEQYRIVRDGLAGLEAPVHILPGDHDMEPGSLATYHGAFGAPALPYGVTVRGHRCLFLDVVSAGTGGPDFRLGEAQIEWVEREIAGADAAGQDVAVFMHTYPADLRAGRETLNRLLAHDRVACVDMGHTHYNELANDGGTIFMATRSTGQIEEGPVGFSVASLDAGCVAWRFKPLAEAWPLVLITHPADRRLVTRRSIAAAVGWALVRVKVLGDAPIAAVTMRVDGRAPEPMRAVAGQPSVWEAPLPDGARRVTVDAWDENGRTDHDSIELPPPGHALPAAAADGSDADRLEAWPEKGIVGGQLGPNRNGRKW